MSTFTPLLSFHVVALVSQQPSFSHLELPAVKRLINLKHFNSLFTSNAGKQLNPYLTYRSPGREELPNKI